MTIATESCVTGEMASRFMSDRDWVSRHIASLIQSPVQGSRLTRLLIENDFIAFGTKLKECLEDEALSEANDLVSEYPEITRLTAKESLQKATLHRIGYRESEDD